MWQWVISFAFGLLSYWLKHDPEKDALKEEIREKDAEIDRLQAPARSKSDIVQSLREHAKD